MAAKKPGIKDISSLKAKLGLKKPPGIVKPPAESASAAPLPAAAPPTGEKMAVPTALPPGAPPAEPLGAPVGGAPIVPTFTQSAATEPEPEPDPFLTEGSTIPSGSALFGGSPMTSVVTHDEGLFVTETDEELQRQASSPAERRLLILLITIPSLLAVAVAFYLGSGAFQREYHETRLRELEKLREEVQKTVDAIAEVRGKVSAIKDFSSGIAVSEWIGSNFTESDLIRKNLLAGRQIAFLRGSTASAMLSYATFTRELWVDTGRFARKTWNSRDELEALSAGPAPRKYGAVILPNEKAFEAYLVLEVERVGVTVEEIAEDGRFGGYGLKVGDTMCKAKLADDAAPDWRPCSGSCSTVDTIGACMVPVPDSPLIPKQHDSLAEEYEQRLAHIRADLDDAAKMGKELLALFESEKSRETKLELE